MDENSNNNDVVMNYSPNGNEAKNDLPKLDNKHATRSFIVNNIDL